MNNDLCYAMHETIEQLEKKLDKVEEQIKNYEVTMIEQELAAAITKALGAFAVEVLEEVDRRIDQKLRDDSALEDWPGIS